MYYCSLKKKKLYREQVLVVLVVVVVLLLVIIIGSLLGYKVHKNIVDNQRHDFTATVERLREEGICGPNGEEAGGDTGDDADTLPIDSYPREVRRAHVQLRAVQFHPHGGQSDFVWLSARTRHGAYVW